MHLWYRPGEAVRAEQQAWYIIVVSFNLAPCHHQQLCRFIIANVIYLNYHISQNYKVSLRTSDPTQVKNAQILCNLCCFYVILSWNYLAQAVSDAESIGEYRVTHWLGWCSIKTSRPAESKHRDDVMRQGVDGWGQSLIIVNTTIRPISLRSNA